MQGSNGRTAHVAVVFPGRITLTALIVALSAAEVPMLEKMAEQLQSPDNAEFKATFKNGALEISLEMDTEAHTEHLDALSGQSVSINAMRTLVHDELGKFDPEDLAGLSALSGSGGLVGVGPIEGKVGISALAEQYENQITPADAIAPSPEMPAGVVSTDYAAEQFKPAVLGDPDHVAPIVTEAPLSKSQQKRIAAQKKKADEAQDAAGLVDPT